MGFQVYPSHSRPQRKEKVATAQSGLDVGWKKHGQEGWESDAAKRLFADNVKTEPKVSWQVASWGRQVEQNLANKKSRRRKAMWRVVRALRDRSERSRDRRDSSTGQWVMGESEHHLIRRPSYQNGRGMQANPLDQGLDTDGRRAIRPSEGRSSTRVATCQSVDCIARRARRVPRPRLRQIRVVVDRASVTWRGGNLA